ncbi:MAG: signal peptide peptidase SppA [Flavobacteriaceae bacterium]|nr:signal peptide peptidase SppA [Flavobacteriaceae bacterium]
MNFLKNFLASILGTLTAIGLFFALILMIISATASVLVSPTGVKAVQSKSVLDLNLNVPVTDRNPSFDELEIILKLNEEVLGLPEVLNAINKAAQNPKIEGIKLRSDYITAGWAQTRSIRNALQNFKKQGKFIYSYADILTQKGYYLASVADSIVLNPVGVFELKGLASEVLYYKDFQDEYGVKMEVVRLGKYKSAVEPYLDNEMSAANRFQIQSLLFDLWETLKNEIAVDRDLSPEVIDTLIKEQKTATPENALAEKLVDALGYESDLKNLIDSRLELDEEEELNLASVAMVNQSIPDYNKELKDRIAVVFAKGPILYGEGTQSIIAQGVFVETLEELAEDDWVKAVVLRIDSPGGSALTSELLWQTINKVKQQKPVLVSMGNVAASGGYYIAAGADQIFADPLSITGSIGVFASLPNASGLLENMGIHVETVETHPDALGYSIFQPLSKAFEIQTKKSIQITYETFKRRVAQGRNLNETVVENIAQGRVWTGKQALEIGLVDSLGGLEETIAAAAKLAGLEEYNRMEYPKFEENLSTLLPGMSLSMEGNRFWNLFFPDQLKPQWNKLKERNPVASMQLLLPYELNIH